MTTKTALRFVTLHLLCNCIRSHSSEFAHAIDGMGSLDGACARAESPNSASMAPEVLAPLLESFYRERAQEKLLSRVRHWERQTGLQALGTRVRVFQSRWASCNAHNILEFHPRVMELATNVQDYVIVHELCHTREKRHTKTFWTLVAHHMPDWRDRHAELERALFGDSI